MEICACLTCICTRSMAYVYALADATHATEVEDRVMLSDFNRVLHRSLQGKMTDADEREALQVAERLNDFARKHAKHVKALRWVHVPVAVSGTPTIIEGAA